jgi:hypothetical protein
LSLDGIAAWADHLDLVVPRRRSGVRPRWLKRAAATAREPDCVFALYARLSGFFGH